MPDMATCRFWLQLVLPSHLPTKGTVMGSGWSMGGAVGGWLSNANFPNAVTVSGSGSRLGGILFGTGAGFNTWINRSDQPIVNIPVGPSLVRSRAEPIAGEIFLDLDEQIASLIQSGILGQGSGKATAPHQTQENIVVVQGPPVPRPPVLRCP